MSSHANQSLKQRGIRTRAQWLFSDKYRDISFCMQLKQLISSKEAARLISISSLASLIEKETVIAQHCEELLISSVYGQRPKNTNNFLADSTLDSYTTNSLLHE